MKTTFKSLSAPGLLTVSLGLAPAAFGDLVEFNSPSAVGFDVTPFTQFDWEAPGNTVFRDANVVSTTGDTTLSSFFASDTLDSTATFDFYYQSRLVAFTGAPAPQWNTLSIDGTPAGCALGVNCYEVTLAMTARETGTLTQTLAGDGVQELTFDSISGNFEAYLDTTPNSTATSGAGYIDGTPFMSGTLQNVTGSFLGLGATNPSGFNTIGTVTAADPSILRALDPLATIVGSQFRTNVSFFANPATEAITVGGSIGLPAQYTVLAADLVRQADANQPLFVEVEQIPEPSNLLLLGGGLFGLAGLRRRMRRRG